MNYQNLKEQELCIIFGFCCDGNLFNSATLLPEEKDRLPYKIKHKYFIEDNKEYFSQPCHYFKGKCTIYRKNRANICSAYRCQILSNFASNKLSQVQAIEIIQRTLLMRQEIFELFHNIIRSNKPISFREILLKLGKELKRDGDNQDMVYGLLAAKCNIFEALLIKHFKSSAEFDKMIISNGK